VIPFSRAPVDTPRITNIRPAVRIISNTNDCAAAPAGIVLPSIMFCGNRNRSDRLAVIAPAYWLTVYGKTAAN